MSADIWKLYDRASGELVRDFDVTGKSKSEKERIFDGMVYKIDFEKFYLDQGDDGE